jgi:hypothetical protein
MGKFIRRFGLTAMAVVVAGACWAQGRISVVINGHPVAFNDTTPRQVDGRVLVPLRGIFEEMGAFVHWTDATQTVDATKGDISVRLQIGNRVAQVNGDNVNLDVPPQLIGGSTMVPLRFVSESLGASVDWRDRDQTVYITTANGPAHDEHYGDQRDRRDRDRDRKGGDEVVVVSPPPPPPPPTHIERRQERHALRSRFAANMVLPLTLDTGISSSDSSPGDPFSATLQTNGQDSYNGLPAGTKVIGHVVIAKRRHGDDPGVLQLAFDRIETPDGVKQRIDGHLIGLDNQSVTRNHGGVLVANASKVQKPGDTAAYVGIGAGAGAAIALISHTNLLTDSAIGGALGYLFHQVQGGQSRPKDVNLGPGTAMGVRLNKPVDIQ